MKSAWIFAAAAVLAVLGSACGGQTHRPLHMDKRSQVERLATYPYAATRMTDTLFQYPALSKEGRFEWRTLTMDIETGAFVERGELVVLIEMNVENRGSREFRWDDYSVFLGIDEGGQWRYRMLFINDRTALIPAGGKHTFRYRTRLAGEGAPSQYSIVFQNILGGRDVAFPFYRQSVLLSKRR